jgi:TfoX/Sxy family transcriptional regulator of competence genes
MTSPLLAMRQRFDPTVTAWPGVTRRTMMGHPGYGVGGKLFAFFDEGQVIVKAPDERRDELLARPGSISWVPPGSGMTRFGQWLALTTADNSDDDLCDALEIAYRHVAASGA